VSVIISDTSPVRALAHLNRLDLLAALFDEVIVPPAVARELRNPPEDTAAVDPDLIPRCRVSAPPDEQRVAELLKELHRGESEAIALALELQVRAILVDERDADAVARRLGLEPLGVLGLLLRAKAAGLVTEIRPLVHELRRGLNFFMTDKLEARVLRTAGE
jgi:uncharacterized protein